VTGNEFIKRLRKLAKAQNRAFCIDTKRGKGSHIMVHVGDRKTVVKDRKKELTRAAVRGMLNQLNINPEDF